jgi:hypothetical protein
VGNIAWHESGKARGKKAVFLTTGLVPLLGIAVAEYSVS